MSRAADAALAARLVETALAAGAEAADVLLGRETALSIGVAGGALEEAERAESVDLGLRVLIGARQACVAASDTADGTLAEMAERAVAIAREAPEDPHCGLAAPEQLARIPDADALELADPGPAPAPAALEAMARAAEAAGLGVAGVTQIEQARASWGREQVTLAASNGFAHAIARSYWAVSASAIAGEGLGRERDFAAELRRHGADMPAPETVGRRAGARAVAALGARRCPAGAFPVIFDERVAGSLVGHVAGAINGQAVARGASWLRDRLGERVLPRGIDLCERPHRRRGRASRLVDAEGLATADRALIADGVLESWVLDLATARQLGLESTGNARRGAGGPPRPGLGNLELAQGDRSRDALLAEMGTGLLVTGLIGSSINPTTGDYSRGANGFWVENGEIVHAVNEITIAGRLPEIVASMVPADDADPEKAVVVPSLLVEGLTIGA
ncbi:TldD/PmbA family protein [Paralimibaculum aggregatum]|uniref:TldD/PmbA family protein n=1 Tax=Paralimibaculum aggregatum TaxID=3036245 RepID=A0ABQ6LEN9_9RHOB|nr:metallopeptidase TldD-related protein [Limibaculum sp. NKW23]GMG81796.1 TldD/PmbA family protein [Limibaculum sp. NKW23]